MARITLNGVGIEAQEGAPLVEVIKKNGVWISNLCYIDGLVPYAGCRSCLVSIEGARGLQLSCTARVSDGMVVDTEAPEVKSARQQVLAIINANHSDRCLTCHRRVKCMPGDICLRDDVVTHRCLTCSKNYRCELQTTNDLLDMGFENVEPWALEPRTYYQTEQPDPDRANPWFEFDPQMCILCTRCVRACDEIRHTTAITLANKGYTSRIAFGAGGPIHESNCDFCGACIDVCPTATLMEKPNKWIARTEDWTSTTCNSCSVGCTISIGTRAGRGVIVKPDLVNPVSADQICVRGRFHYEAVPDKKRLQRHLVRRGPPGSAQLPAHWGELVEYVAGRIKDVVAAHAAGAVGVLGSPFNTNEENYLAQKLARDVIGTPHVDFSQAAPNRAAMKAVEAAFGTEALPADMLRLGTSDIVIVIADDLESSHNVAALRAKDAIVGNPAAPRHGTLLLVSPLWGEMADFAEPYGGTWLQPRPGAEAALVDALAQRAAGGQAALPPVAEGDLPRALEILGEAKDPGRRVSIIYAPNPGDAQAAGNGARAAANLSIALRGDSAGESLIVLPTEANVYGARDMGVDPELGPGRTPLAEPGMSFDQMIDAAASGALKALIVVGDNPLMFAPGSARVRDALASLDLLVVIDSLLSATAQAAHVVLADVPSYGKTGTYTNGERRIDRLHAAVAALGDARPALLALTDLANAIGGADTWSYAHPDAVTDEIAASVPGYERFGAGFGAWGKARAAVTPSRFERQPVSAASAAPAAGELLLTTGRTLYTSLEGAAIHAPDADKLHREEFVELHPADAAAMRIADEDEVMLVSAHGELTLRCKISGRVQEGVAFVPVYYDGGAVNRLLAADGAPAGVRLNVAEPA
ncbi:MAG: molybdopterin-dependent oxidoreductase [Dehalococcoidia bacterium]|nr:molybdopterin-dependent oxidoreductase [Dehalococcoidia bacterium]